MALLRLYPVSTASFKLLTTTTDPITAQTQQMPCSSLPANTDLNASNSCIGNLFPNGTEVETRGIKIDDPSSDVHVSIKNNGVDEGFLAIPDDALGKKYYVATFCRFGGYCQFSVTPVKDNTSIMVHFPVGINNTSVCLNGFDKGNLGSSVELPFLLDEFDVLHIESKNDLTGTYITANKNVAVFAGARNVPAADGTESHMIEQLLPVNKWGTKFYVVPNIYNPAGDEFLIVASMGSTEIDIGGFSPFIIPDAGQFVTRRIDCGMYTVIDASHPVFLLQLMSIDVYNDSTSVSGHPAMVTVQSEGHFKSSYTGSCGSEACSVGDPFVAIVAEGTVKTGIQFVGVANPSNWIQILNTNMYVAVVNITASTNNVLVISHDNQMNFSIYGYFSRGRANLLALNWDYVAEVGSVLSYLFS